MVSRYMAALCGLGLVITLQAPALAETFAIDTTGAHASINFKIRHLGFSWLTGRFDSFSGTFQYDPSAPEKSQVNVEIDTTSVNSNQAKRDKHLRSGDFLDVANHPKATFVSTSIAVTGKNSADITGDLTLHGVTKQIVIKASHVGGGDDPWGGFRQGFEGTTQIKLADFGINFDLGPSATHVDLTLNVEGVRQK